MKRKSKECINFQALRNVYFSEKVFIEIVTVVKLVRLPYVWLEMYCLWVWVPIDKF